MNYFKLKKSNTVRQVNILQNIWLYYVLEEETDIIEKL